MMRRLAFALVLTLPVFSPQNTFAQPRLGKGATPGGVPPKGRPGGPGGNVDNPCAPLREACIAAGFKPRGHEEGKGIKLDCVDKLVAGQKVSGVKIDPSSKEVKACLAYHNSKPQGPGGPGGPGGGGGPRGGGPVGPKGGQGRPSSSGGMPSEPNPGAPSK